jgi:transposase
MGLFLPHAVWFAYSAKRQGIHPQTHLKDFSGILQADAFAGYDAIYAMGKVTEAGFRADMRSKFHEIHITSSTPISTHVLAQIAALYHIESSINLPATALWLASSHLLAGLPQCTT